MNFSLKVVWENKWYLIHNKKDENCRNFKEIGSAFNN